MVCQRVPRNQKPGRPQLQLAGGVQICQGSRALWFRQRRWWTGSSAWALRQKGRQGLILSAISYKMIVISPTNTLLLPAGRTLARPLAKPLGSAAATTAWKQRWMRPLLVVGQLLEETVADRRRARCCWWRIAWAASPGGRPTPRRQRCAAPCWWPRAMWGGLIWPHMDHGWAPIAHSNRCLSPPCWLGDTGGHVGFRHAQSPG